MIRSMTGYGEALVQVDAGTARATLRSWNAKALDVRWTGPTELAHLELVFLPTLRQHVRRGRVELRVEWTPAAATAGRASVEEFEPMIARLRAIKREFGLAGELTIGDVVAAGGEALRVRQATDVEAAEPAVLKALEGALELLLEFREREGLELARLFDAACESLAELTSELTQEAEATVPALNERLRARLRQLLPEGQEPLEAAVRTELALLADRADVAEELQRASAHVAAMVALVRGGDLEAGHGKRLDFLLQECTREFNTMGSKSASSDLTHRVVEAKGLVERLREQAQNVE